MKQDPFKTDDGRSKCSVRLSNEAYQRIQLYAIHWKTTLSELVDSLILKYLPPVQITFTTKNTEDFTFDCEDTISEDLDGENDDDN